MLGVHFSHHGTPWTSLGLFKGPTTHYALYRGLSLCYLAIWWASHQKYCYYAHYFILGALLVGLGHSNSLEIV